MKEQNKAGWKSWHGTKCKAWNKECRLEHVMVICHTDVTKGDDDDWSFL